MTYRAQCEGRRNRKGWLRERRRERKRARNTKPTMWSIERMQSDQRMQDSIRNMRPLNALLKRIYPQENLP